MRMFQLKCVSSYTGMFLPTIYENLECQDDRQVWEKIKLDHMPHRKPGIWSKVGKSLLFVDLGKSMGLYL